MSTEQIQIDKASPSTSQVHIDRALTNVSVAYMQSAENFIADKIFPVVRVQKKSDKYFIYSKGDMLRIVAEKRAPSTESAGSGYDLSTGNYFCENYALHKDVSDEERDNSDAPLNAYQDATEYVTENLLMKRERDFLQTIFQASTWGADVTPTTKWNAAGSTPLKDIKTYARALAKRIGKNRKDLKLVVTADVDDVLTEHPDFVSRVQYTSTESVDSALIARLCGIGEYMVAEAVEAPNPKGSATENDLDYMVSPNQAFLCYVAPRASLKQPSAGYIFSWTGGGAGSYGPTIERMDIRLKKTTRIEGTMNYDNKIVAADAGTYIHTILS